VLIQHQKSKHFKCHVCNKKMVAIGALTTHLMHVHKVRGASHCGGSDAATYTPVLVVCVCRCRSS